MRLALSEDIQMFDPSNFQLLDESVSENDPCAVGIRMLMLSGDVPLLTGLVYAEYRDPMPTPMPGVLNARGRHCHQSSRHDSCRHHVDSASPDSLTFENVVAWLINEETRQSSSDESTKMESNDAALAAASRRTGVCHFSERPGHFKSECRERQKWEDWRKGTAANVAYSSDEHAF